MWVDMCGRYVWEALSERRKIKKKEKQNKKKTKQKTKKKKKKKKKTTQKQTKKTKQKNLMYEIDSEGAPPYLQFESSFLFHLR